MTKKIFGKKLSQTIKRGGISDINSAVALRRKSR